MVRVRNTCVGKDYVEICSKFLHMLCTFAIDHKDASPAAAKEWTRGEGGDWIDGVVLDIAELPDRNSPPGQPDMMLVTAEELRKAIDDNAPHILSGDRHE